MSMTDQLSVSNQDARGSLEPRKSKMENTECIELQFTENLTSEIMKKLITRISSAGQLAILKLDFKKNDVSSRTLSKIASIIKEKKNLTVLTLNLELCKNIDDTFVESLKDALAKKTNISELFLNFAGTKVTNTAVIELAKILKKNQNIPIIEADLDYFKDVDDGLMIKIENSPDKDKSISLRLSFSKFMVKTNAKRTKIIELIESLKKDPNLEKIDINLHNGLRIIDNESIFIFSALLKNFRNITEFRLNLECTNINDESFIQILDMLKGKQKITAFFLFLNDTKITYASLSKLAEILEDNQNIEILKLYLNDLKVNGISIMQLAMTIQQFQNLKDLTLYLNNTGIKGYSLFTLAEALKDKQDLAKLDLRLQKAQIKDDPICKVIETLINLPNFKNFFLDLTESTASEDLFVKLKKPFKNTQNLESFNFICCGIQYNFEQIDRTRSKILDFRAAYKGKKICIWSPCGYLE